MVLCVLLNSNSFDQIFMSPIGGPLGGGVLADGAGGQRSLDVREAKKALSRGDPEVRLCRAPLPALPSCIPLVRKSSLTSLAPTG